MKSKARNFSLSGFMRLVRWPNLVILGLSQYLAAFFLAKSVVSLFDPYLFLLTASTVILAASGYLINDYYDVKIDYINRPRSVIVDKILKRRVVMLVHSAMNFTGIAIGFLLSIKIGLIHFFAAFLLWLYSNQLKRMPLVGNFVIALLSGLAISIVAIYYQENERLVHTYAVFAFCISLIREIIKDMEDVKGDAAFGCKTLPVIWGIAKTKKLVYLFVLIFYGLLFGMSYPLQNNVLFIYFLLFTPIIGYFFWKLYYADTAKDFGFLSQFIKLIILCGILSMMFF